MARSGSAAELISRAKRRASSLDHAAGRGNREESGGASGEQIENSLGVVLGEEILEDLAHPRALGVESGLEGRPGIFAPVAQGPGEPLPPLGAGRDQMGLTLPFHLEAVLDAPEEAVGLQQLLRDVRLEDSGFGQRAQGAGSRAASDLGHPSAVDQLQRLGDELDVADPAAPELDVEGTLRQPLLALDLLLHLLDGVDAAEVHGGPVDHRIDGPGDAPAELAIAGDGPAPS